MTEKVTRPGRKGIESMVEDWVAFLGMAHMRRKDRPIPQNWAGSTSLGSSSCRTKMIPGERERPSMELTAEVWSAQGQLRGHPYWGPGLSLLLTRNVTLDQPFHASLCFHMSIGMMVQSRGTTHEKPLSSSCHVYLEMWLA